MQFQRITTLALDVKYGSDDVFDKDLELRLLTIVQNRSEMFSNHVELKGHTFEFDHEPPKGKLVRVPELLDSNQEKDRVIQYNHTLKP